MKLSALEYTELAAVIDMNLIEGNKEMPIGMQLAINNARAGYSN
jgi:hypothetical protein